MGVPDDVLRYPLFSALVNRRTRRVARGVSVDAGALSHESTNQPAPLTPLQEAMLVVATGLTGITTMDGPLDIPAGGKELGVPFVNSLARSASSPDNSQPTHMFMTNDEGIFYLDKPTGRAGLELLRDLPARWEDWKEDDWIGVAATVKRKVSDKRLSFPREYPYYLGWNKQLSNVPGTTMFLPVVDTTRMYINGLLNLSSEPDGQRPMFVDDWRCFHPRDVKDWAAWAAEHLKIVPKIPYQIIGGVETVQRGFVNKDIPIPLGFARTMFSDHESYFLQQNLVLAAQAMGLGAWIHVGVQAPDVFTVDEKKGWNGLGFRFLTPEKKWRTWPPVPASQPNPVGLDGVLEGLCPPYVASMDEAVDRLIEEKYATYDDAAVFGQAYAGAGDPAKFQASAVRYEPEAVAYTKEVCNYIFDTYGRFPAHCDAMFAPGTWVQVCRIELEYYEKYFRPSLFRRQAEYPTLWEEH